MGWWQGQLGCFTLFFFFFLNVLILYLAVLGLHCYTGSSLVVASGAPFQLLYEGFLRLWLVTERGP